MTIYQTLKNDHDTVEKLLQKLKKGQGPKIDERTFETLKTEVLLHAHAEEKVFYAVLREHREAQELVRHATREHKQLEDLLEEMSDLDPQTEEFKARLEELRGAIEDHVEEEEGDVFETARKLVSDEEARRMEDSFLQEKERLKKELGKDAGAEAENRSGVRH